MPLYEKHGLCFVTAVFQICPAYVDRGGEINFIDVFGFLRCFYHSMSGYQFAETCFFTPAHPVKLFNFFQRKIFFRKIGCKTDIGSVIKTNPDDSKFIPFRIRCAKVLSSKGLRVMLTSDPSQARSR